MADDDEPAAGLKLRATDRDDLAVLSAALQDSLVAVVDMVYLADRQRFVMVVNRFKWETAGEAPEPGYLRTHCGVSFFGVGRVRTRGLDLGHRQTILSLLALELADGEVRLVFSGDREVRLELNGSGETALDCRMADFGEPWPTANRPRHPFEENGETP